MGRAKPVLSARAALFCSQEVGVVMGDEKQRALRGSDLFVDVSWRRALADGMQRRCVACVSCGAEGEAEERRGECGVVIAWRALRGGGGGRDV
mgnify:FL=1